MRFRFSSGVRLWLSHRRPFPLSPVAVAVGPVVATITVASIAIAIPGLWSGVGLSYSIGFSRPSLPTPVAVAVGPVVATITVASVAIAIPGLWFGVGLRGGDG